MRIRSAGVLELRVGRSSIHARAERRGATTWAAEGRYESLAELSDLIGRLAGECGIPCGRARVALEHPPVQLRTLTDLPPVRDAELAALVAHQVGRLFRKNGHPLVTDAVWVRRNGARIAQAAAVDESLVAAIVAGTRAAGVVLETIAVADTSLPLALLPGAERASRARAARKRTRGLGFAAAAIWTVVALVFVARLAWERRTVDRELARLRAPLVAVLAARREIHGIEAALGAIARADGERGQALAFLARVTAALPDSAALTSLAWSRSGPTLLSGAARQAGRVPAELQGVVAGETAAFDGPVMRETLAGGDWDRFTVVFRRGARTP